MKKLFILVTLSIGLFVGCSAETKTITDNYILPPELSHCKIFKLSNVSNHMRVVYCPLAVTTTTYVIGNASASNTIIAEDTMGMGEYQRLQQKFDTTGYGEYERLKSKFGEQYG